MASAKRNVKTVTAMILRVSVITLKNKRRRWLLKRMSLKR